MNIKKIVCFVVACAALSACSDPKAAKEAAEEQGFSDVKTQGYSFFGCSKDDMYHTNFTARAQNGKCVTGVVCSAWLKGNTLRTTGTVACP